MQAFFKTDCSRKKWSRRRNGPTAALCHRWSIGCSLVVASWLSWACIAQSNALPKLDEVASVKSEFIDNSNFGKDPFFPQSTRRGLPTNTNVVVEPTVQNSNLSLKGISGLQNRRLAIINNRTFEAGEEADVKVGNQVIKVRCVEIREKSAVVSINGLTKELFLGQRL